MRKVSFALDQLSDSDVDCLAEMGHKESVPAGVSMIHEKKPSDSVYIVLSGILSISVSIRGKQEVTRLGHGEIIGEMSFLKARSSSTSVKALDDSVVFAIPKRKLASKLEEDMSFAAHFYYVLAITLANRLRNTVVRLSSDRHMESDETPEHKDKPEARIPDTLYAADFRIDHILKRLMDVEPAVLQASEDG